MTIRKTPGSPYFIDNNIESPDFREITNPKEQELHFYDFKKHQKESQSKFLSHLTKE